MRENILGCLYVTVLDVALNHRLCFYLYCYGAKDLFVSRYGKEVLFKMGRSLSCLMKRKQEGRLDDLVRLLCLQESNRTGSVNKIFLRGLIIKISCGDIFLLLSYYKILLTYFKIVSLKNIVDCYSKFSNKRAILIKFEPLIKLRWQNIFVGNNFNPSIVFCFYRGKVANREVKKE